MSEKAPILKWIDEHRELILLLIVLPLGKVISLWTNLLYSLSRPSADKHDQRVERVCREVKERQKSGKPLRTDRKGTETLESRVSDKSDSTKIKVQDLRTVLSLDMEKGLIRIEPYITIGEVVSYLDKRDLELETAIEMKGATMGGLVLAIGMTTHSHISGLMHDIVEAYEIVTASGELVRATREGEHSDLFRALPLSHGTLGFLVAMELRIKKAPKYVELVYRPFFNHDEFINEHTRLLTDKNPPYYLEGQIFGHDKAVIIEGYPSEKKKLPGNNINLWYKPFFFKHVESMFKLGKGGEYRELVPNRAYLMRHERSMCMTLGKILPTANNPLYRALFGWLLPPNLSLLKSSRPREERERTMKYQVYQDFGFPADRLKEILKHLHNEFEIYPLLLYPCRVFDRGGMIRLPGEHGKPWNGQTNSALYLNLGIYGHPKAIRHGDRSFPTIKKVRVVEEMIRNFGGFLHTYVDLFSAPEEFETMFDHSLWKKMREKYEANHVFPTIYEKVKPEIDPFELM